MNAAHWHLVFNHVPVTLTILGTLWLGLALALKNRVITKSALVIFILAAITGVPALLTGEGAEEVLESIGQKNEHFIHEHEEVAENAFWIGALSGILSLITFLRIDSGKKIFTRMLLVILLLGIVNSVLITIAADSGGEIRHTEIRPAE